MVVVVKKEMGSRGDGDGDGGGGGVGVDDGSNSSEGDDEAVVERDFCGVGDGGKMTGCCGIRRVRVTVTAEREKAGHG